MLVLILLGKLLAFGKDIAISASFGASSHTDAYFVATSIPSFIFLGFFTAVSVVFLPIYNEIMVSRGRAEASKFASNAINIFALLSIGISVVGILFASQLFSFVAPKFSEETKYLGADLTKLACLSFVFNITVSFLSNIQYVDKKYFGPQLIPVLNNILIIGFVVIFGDQYGVFTIVIGGLTGWMLQLPLQKYLSGSSFRYSPVLQIRDSSVGRMFEMILPAFIGVSVDQFNVIIDNNLGSGLESGSLSALNYALKLTNVFSGLSFVVITSVIYPVLSNLIVSKDIEEVTVSLSLILRGFIITILPISLFMVYYNSAIVSLVFERGAFDSSTTSSTSKVLVCYVVGLVFVVIREVLNKVFYAFQDSNTPMIISVFAIIINIVLSLWLVGLMGESGLALATSISICSYVVIQFIMLGKHLALGLTRGSALFFFKVVLCLCSMLVGLMVGSSIMVNDDSLFGVIVGALLGGIAYLCCLVVLRVEECLLVLSMLRERIGLKTNT